MMKFIATLIFYIEIQQKIIVYLMSSLLGQNLASKPPEDLPIDKPYRKLVIDQLPIIHVPEKFD